MTAIVDDLKSAAGLLEKAVELVREATKETSLPSVALRQAVREVIARIRLQLMLLRHDLTIVHNTANRRKPRPARTEKLL